MEENSSTPTIEVGLLNGNELTASSSSGDRGPCGPSAGRMVVKPWKVIVSVVLLGSIVSIDLWATSFLSTAKKSVRSIEANRLAKQRRIVAFDHCNVEDGTSRSMVRFVNTTTVAIPHLQEMLEKKQCLSVKQQYHFFSKKDQVLDWIKSSPKLRPLLNIRSSYLLSKYFAYVLNEKYAFRHIFKDGGTTVEYQLKERGKNFHQLNEDVLGNDMKLVAVVRDPIDHFLSGWAECGKRLPKFLVPQNNTSYDERIQMWLNLMELQECGRHFDRALCLCSDHSLPQAVFLFKGKGPGTTIHPNLEIVGHIKELDGVLELVNFGFNSSISTGRNATENPVKATHFPKRIDLLSQNTLQKLCQFLALDYYFFDFEPPEECHSVLEGRNSSGLSLAI
mmetsp:Transcript_21905/g.38568  ORF Transcript_21905/g.38568 Transcript_21905/m.38568 type:complete len:392 (+) Transcript_21905:67-1242(+)